jgi:glyoxylase-like metal-dependent hydrolase (beta-lactamase superfamily II)
MLRQVADGVLVHESEFIESNAVAVRGDAGVLLIDAGVTADEMVAIADDLRALGQPVVAGFSTHPHRDHLLWHAGFGEVSRYGTARCVAEVAAFLANPRWEDEVAEELPPEIEVPLDVLGSITGLQAAATRIPWDGPGIRIIEHRAHAPGHAALLPATVPSGERGRRRHGSTEIGRTRMPSVTAVAPTIRGSARRPGPAGNG